MHLKLKLLNFFYLPVTVSLPLILSLSICVDVTQPISISGFSFDFSNQNLFTIHSVIQYLFNDFANIPYSQSRFVLLRSNQYLFSLCSWSKSYSISYCIPTEIRDTFNMFDKNGDGMITTEELGQVMVSLGQRPTLDELKSFIRVVDTDRK